MSVDVQEELARGCRDRHHALVKCYEVSNRAPKEIYGPLKISQATFSRILSGDAYLPHNDKLNFMKLCGNIIPVRYDVWKLDHEIKPVQTDLEKRLAQSEERVADLERANRLLVEMIRGK